MAIPTGASERPDDQGTSPPLKETNETMLEDATKVPPKVSHPESPPKIPQENEEVRRAEEEKTTASQESEDSSEERSEDEEGEDAQEGSSERTGSDVGDRNDNIEVVDLTDGEEDDEDANNDGDGIRTNEQMDFEMDVTPLRMELPGSSQPQTAEEELANLKRNDPIGYIKAKLAQRDTPLSQVGTGSTSDAMAHDDRVVLLHRIRKTILDVDLFEVLKQDSTTCFVMKGLLNQVDLATCSLEVSTILFELQSLLDNVTGFLLQDESAAVKVQEKKASMNAAYEQASKLSKEAEEQAAHIKQARTDYELRSQSIVLWEKQIQELRHKIQEAQQQKIAYESNTFGSRFEELLNKGLAETEAAEQLKGEVAILEGAKRFTQKRLESFRNIFDRLRTNPHF